MVLYGAMHGRVPLPKHRRSWLAPLFGFGLRVHLGVLVAAALLPALVLGALVFWDGAAAFRRSSEARLADNARALAQAIGRDITIQRTIVDALTDLVDPTDSEAELEGFATSARRLAAPVEGWVVLVDPAQSRQLVNTRLPAGAPLPASWGPSPLRDEVMAGTGTRVLNLASSPTTAEPILRVVAAVHADSTVVRLLSLQTSPGRLVAMLQEVPLGAGGIATLIDGRGRVVARSQDHERWVGQTLPSWTVERARTPRNFELRNLDGIDTLAASHPVPGTPGWYVTVSEPRAPFARLDNDAFVKPLGGALLSLALGVLMVLWLAGRLVRPVEALAQETADGALPPASGAQGQSGIREIDALAERIVEARESLRRRATEAENQTALIASVIDNTEDVVFAKDTALRFVLVNRALLRSMGRTTEEVIDNRSIDLFPRPVAERIEAHDREVMRSGEVTPYEIDIPGPWGLRKFLTVKCPWRDGNGRIIGMVAVSRDITNARQVEERLAAAQARLLQVSRLGATGAMAAGLAHEINQPLTATTNYASLATRLLGESGTPPPPRERIEEVRRVLPNAIAQARRAGAILARLRGFISDGAGEFSPEPVEEVVRDAAAIASATLVREDVELALDLAPGLGTAWIDRVQVQQVLFNLLRNAAEALRDRPDRRIRLAARRTMHGTRNVLEIDVSDNGPGLPDDVLAHLFEPFVTTKADGLGVGLAICRRVIEAHHGRLEAGRAPEGGALFRIVLPDPEVTP